ncbi:hypothetical protein CB1_000163019 [Camelus ferus]|nr:hypothetical protein CB1_000163019 [Camelus ferus]
MVVEAEGEENPWAVEAMEVVAVVVAAEEDSPVVVVAVEDSNGPGWGPGGSHIGVATEMIIMVAEEAMIGVATEAEEGTGGFRGGWGGGDRGGFGPGKKDSRDSATEDGMSPHAIDDDRSGRAQQQGRHDDNGGQDDEDNDPDVQDVLGEHGFHGGLADGVHAASLCNRQEKRTSACATLPLPPSLDGSLPQESEVIPIVEGSKAGRTRGQASEGTGSTISLCQPSQSSSVLSDGLFPPMNRGSSHSPLTSL